MGLLDFFKDPNELYPNAQYPSPSPWAVEGDQKSFEKLKRLMKANEAVDLSDELAEKQRETIYRNKALQTPGQVYENPIGPLAEMGREVAAVEEQANPNKVYDAPIGPQNQVQPPLSEQEKMLRMLQAQDAEKRKRLEQYLNRDKAGLAGMEEALRAQLAQKSQTDISPLMALSDTWFGGNLAKGYRAPQSANENAQQGLSNMNALQLRREKLTELANSGGGGESNYLRTVMAMKKDENSEKNRSLREKTGLFNAFNGDQDVKDIRKGSQALGEAKNLLASNSRLGESGLKTKFARIMGAAPISDTDLRMMSGNQSLVETWKRNLQRWSTGEITESDRADFTAFIDAADKYYGGRFNSKVDYYVNDVAPNVYSIDPERASSFISGRAYASGGGGTQPSAPRAPNSADTVVGKDGRTYVKNPETGKYRPQ